MSEHKHVIKFDVKTYPCECGLEFSQEFAETLVGAALSGSLPTVQLGIDLEFEKRRVAELEAQLRWRVVANGELPELGKEVIFYDSKMEGLLKGCLRKNGGVEWLSDEGYTFSSRDGRYSRITHWMYAPQPPEVQE